MARRITDARGKSQPRTVDASRRKLPREDKPAKRAGTLKRKGRLLARGGAFTPEIQAAIIGYAEAGLPRKYAAGRVGIGERTLQRWVEDGRDNLELVAEGEGELDAKGAFFQLLIQAESFARGRLVKRIYKASKDDWKAGAWLLERSDSAEFGQSHKLEGIVRNEDGEEVSAGDMLLDKLAEIADREARYAGEGVEGE